jgi:phage gp37-like protein
MQFRVATHTGDVDLGAVERELHAVDPAAMVDFDGAGDQLRVSTFMSVFELIEVVDRAGYPVTHDQVVSMKSDCCGGCSG